jgi:hypothetical protein
MKLTIPLVVEACRHALADGTLLATNRDAAEDEDGEIQCLYAVNGFRCAIGVALDPPTLAYIAEHELQHMPLEDLIRSEVVDVDVNDLAFLERLQRAHDTWLQACSSQEEFKRNEFMTLLNSV